MALFSQLHAFEYPILQFNLRSQAKPSTISTESLDALVEDSLASLCIVSFDKGATWSQVLSSYWNDGFSGGTGFFITSQGHLLTNKHVVHSNPHVILYLAFASDQAVNASIVAEHPTEDLVLLKMDNAVDMPFKHLKLSSERQEVGNWVFSLRGRARILNGNLVAFPTIGKVMGYIDGHVASSMAAIGGNSGSPLLSLEGKVIGILTVGNSVAGINIGSTSAVSIEKVKEWIEKTLQQDGCFESLD